MDPAAWQRVIDAMIREARTITDLLATGRPLTRDQLTRAATIRAIMGETAGALTDAGKAADYLFSKHLAPQLHASLNDLDAALAGHAAVAAADITGLAAPAGYQIIPNLNALQAIAARSSQAITHDWQRLTATARDLIVGELNRAMAAGLNPADAYQLLSQALEEVGGNVFARAMNIARTEMADCYDAARMHTITGVDGVIVSW